jgi:hypothetical protein
MPEPTGPQWKYKHDKPGLVPDNPVTRGEAPLYHGTTAGFLKKGDYLKPSGGASNYDVSSKEHIYVTPDPEQAQTYAVSTYEELKNNNQLMEGAHPTVYQVHPRSVVEPDPNTFGALRSKGSARILGKQWEAPMYNGSPWTDDGDPPVWTIKE